MSNTRANQTHFVVEITFGAIRTIRRFCAYGATAVEAEATAMKAAKTQGLSNPSVLVSRESQDCLIPDGPLPGKRHGRGSYVAH